MMKEYKNIKIETIIPEKIYDNTTQKGERYVAVKVNKTKYSCFDATLFRYFKEGQPVTVQVAESKGYYNIVGVENDDMPEKKSAATGPVNFVDQRADGMAKGAAFNKAVDMAIAILGRKGEIADVKGEEIIKAVKYYFEEFKKINQ